MSAVRKSTNLYRRVSAVNYKNTGTGNKYLRHSHSKCLVCLVTLVKSSKDKKRAGIELRCQCNVRVCATCLNNNPEWYLTEPHFTMCPTLRGFICTVCACFECVKEKVCCVWMCSRCSAECKKQGSPCSKCSTRVHGRSGGETRTLCDSNGIYKDPEDGAGSVHVEETIAAYKDLVRARVFDKVSQSRHLSASDIRTLFHECYAPQMCTCVSESKTNPMCTSCTPVLTVMQLLAKNPRPLIASLAERAIPGRALARNVYNKALLIGMLNDQHLPLCVNARSCKGMLLGAHNNNNDNPKPLPCLLSPQAYNGFLARKAQTGPAQQQIESCCCILCLLFNQSAAVAHMLSPDSLRLEPRPSGPVYYFNVKLSPDVGVPEVCIDDHHGYLVNFQGSVGSYKPTFYYNWRDMLKVLHREDSGTITLLPL